MSRGANTHCCHSSGQVGVGSMEDVTTPTLLASLNSQVVRAVVCGDDHTVALTEVLTLSGCVPRMSFSSLRMAGSSHLGPMNMVN